MRLSNARIAAPPAFSPRPSANLHSCCAERPLRPEHRSATNVERHVPLACVRAIPSSARAGPQRVHQLQTPTHVLDAALRAMFVDVLLVEGIAFVAYDRSVRRLVFLRAIYSFLLSVLTAVARPRARRAKSASLLPTRLPPSPVHERWDSVGADGVHGCGPRRARFVAVSSVGQRLNLTLVTQTHLASPSARLWRSGATHGGRGRARPRHARSRPREA